MSEDTPPPGMDWICYSCAKWHSKTEPQTKGATGEVYCDKDCRLKVESPITAAHAAESETVEACVDYIREYAHEEHGGCQTMIDLIDRVDTARAEVRRLGGET